MHWMPCCPSSARRRLRFPASPRSSSRKGKRRIMRAQQSRRTSPTTHAAYADWELLRDPSPFTPSHHAIRLDIRSLVRTIISRPVSPLSCASTSSSHSTRKKNQIKRLSLRFQIPSISGPLHSRPRPHPNKDPSWRNETLVALLFTIPNTLWPDSSLSLLCSHIYHLLIPRSTRPAPCGQHLTDSPIRWVAFTSPE